MPKTITRSQDRKTRIEHLNVPTIQSQTKKKVTRQVENDTLKRKNSEKERSPLQGTKGTCIKSEPMDSINSFINEGQVRKRIFETATTKFHTAFDESVMVFRENESAAITKCVSDFLESNRSKAIYVCGAPGTGKTSTVLATIESLRRLGKFKEQFETSYINGTMVSNVESLLLKCVAKEKPNGVIKRSKTKLEKQKLELIHEYKNVGLNAALDVLKKIRSQLHTPRLIVVLDEADQVNELTWKASIGTGAVSASMTRGSQQDGRHPRHLPTLGTRAQNGRCGLLEELVCVSVEPDLKMLLICISNSLLLGTDLKHALQLRHSFPLRTDKGENSAKCNVKNLNNALGSLVNGPESRGRRATTTTRESVLPTVAVEMKKSQEPRNNEAIELLTFPTYTENELQNILDKRVERAKHEVMLELDSQCSDDRRNSMKKFVNSFKLFDRLSTTLVVKKLAVHQGDCRQLLEACRDVLSHTLARIQSTMDSDCLRHSNRKRRPSSSDSEEFASPLKKFRSSEEDGNLDSNSSSDDSLTSPTHPSKSHSTMRLVPSSSFSTTTASTSSPSRSPVYPSSPIRSTRRTGQQRKTGQRHPPHSHNNDRSPNSSNSLNSPNSPNSPNSFNNSHIHGTTTDQTFAQLEVQLQNISLHDTQRVLSHHFQHFHQQFLSRLQHAPLHQQILLLAALQVVKRSEKLECQELSLKGKLERGSGAVASKKQHLASSSSASLASRLLSYYVDPLAIQNEYRSFCKEHCLEEKYNTINLIDGLAALEQNGVLKLYSHPGPLRRGTTKRLHQNNNNTYHYLSVEVLVHPTSIERVLCELKSVFKRMLLETGESVDDAYDSGDDDDDDDGDDGDDDRNGT